MFVLVGVCVDVCVCVGVLFRGLCSSFVCVRFSGCLCSSFSLSRCSVCVEVCVGVCVLVF